MQDQLEWLWEGIKVTIGPIVGFLCGHVSGSFGQKRAQTARVLERYIQAAGQQREAQNDAAFRMGLLQRSGAAELSRRQLARLARSRRCPWPYRSANGIRSLFRLSQRSLSLVAMGKQ